MQDMQIQEGGVLYLCLEDTFCRIQGRLFRNHIIWNVVNVKQEIRLKAPGWKNVARMDEKLGEEYSEDEIRAVLAGKKEHTPRKKPAVQTEPPKVNLLVDIQAKLQAGKGAGYTRRAKVFKLKQMAQTMNYLTEHGIAVLRIRIINYVNPREVYAAYRKHGYSKKFLAEHESEILLHKVSKQAFDDLGIKKLPAVYFEWGNSKNF